jgi:urease accessory protein
MDTGMRMNMNNTTTSLTTCQNGQTSRIALLQAFDSLFPTGSYTMSGGMETYTQKGIVKDKATLIAFLKAQLYILPYGDLGVCAKAAQGESYLVLDELCAAMKQPFEIRTGSEKLCLRFLKMQETLCEYPSLAEYYSAIQQKKCHGHYPVALGLFIRDLNAELEQALEMYCYSLLSQAVNHAVKLIPLGQSDGQAALYETLRLIPQAVQKAISATTDELGVCACGFDLRSMQHETLHGRLYIS